MLRKLLTDKKQTTLWILTLYVSFVFIQSLFFKFTGSPETVHIFSTLDVWAEDVFGLAGLFAPGGIFSARVVGSAELVASAMLLVGMITGSERLHGAGALIGLGVISGAIFFHLFTPLGTVIVNSELGVASDGGTLFIMACGVWASCATIVLLRRQDLMRLLSGSRG